MSGRSVNLTTLFLGCLGLDLLWGLPVLCAHTFTSNRQLPFLNQRKEKRKYVARLGIEARTSDLRVRCPTNCATRPGCGSVEEVVTMCHVYVMYPLEYNHDTSQLCPRSTGGRAPDWKVRGPGFDTRSGHILLFLLPLTQEGQLSVTVYFKQQHNNNNNSYIERVMTMCRI